MINSNTDSQTEILEQGLCPVGGDCYHTICLKLKIDFFVMPIIGTMAIAPYGILSLSSKFYFMPILFNGALKTAPYGNMTI
ncbi:hypothetical protein KKC13_13000 [bacterium]|nr:hypothetical protein [bacterium]MBU1959551.1 hypothetical protein [bacterium]